MPPAAIIIFRETLEIAMILGVVLAATRGLADRAKWIAGGMLAGLAGAALVAAFAQTISAFASGMGQELFNAGILFTAAIVIGWTVIWMKSHARDMVAQLREVGRSVSEGTLPGASLMLIIGLAMLREGSEIVLFIYGLRLSGDSIASIAAGSVIGLTLGAIVGTLLYFGLIRMSARYMLLVTGWLLILLVSGLASQGAGYLSAAGYFETLSAQVWNTSWLLSDSGVTGKALHSLIGYTARPTAIQLLFYVGTMLTLLSILTVLDKKSPAQVAHSKPA